MDNSLILAFQFCVELHERHGLYITSSFGFSGRMEVSSDFPLAAALLDRLTHHCHVLLFPGEPGATDAGCRLRSHNTAISL